MDGDTGGGADARIGGGLFVGASSDVVGDDDGPDGGDDPMAIGGMCGVGGGTVTAFIDAVETFAGGGGGARTPLAAGACAPELDSSEPPGEGARPSS